MDYKKYIVKNIQTFSGKYTQYRIFSDWIQMMALAIQNTCILWKPIRDQREQQYLDIAKKYTEEEIKTFCDMAGALSMALEERFGDILGEIYMESGCGNKGTGQFFTPYHLSYATASLLYADKFSKDEILEVNEPSTGGGGMLIALAEVMKDKGVNYQRKLHVVAQDLDWNGVYMTYVQLSLLGVKAIVVQGDTLMEPYRKGYDARRVFRTPAEMGLLL